jgi:hypothetical protein
MSHTTFGVTYIYSSWLYNLLWVLASSAVFQIPYPLPSAASY